MFPFLDISAFLSKISNCAKWRVGSQSQGCLGTEVPQWGPVAGQAWKSSRSWSTFVVRVFNVSISCKRVYMHFQTALYKWSKNKPPSFCHLVASSSNDRFLDASTGTPSNKFAIKKWSVKTPSHNHCVATLPCEILMSAFECWYLQGSFTKLLRCGEIFNYHFIANRAGSGSTGHGSNVVETWPVNFYEVCFFNALHMVTARRHSMYPENIYCYRRLQK